MVPYPSTVRRSQYAQDFPLRSSQYSPQLQIMVLFREQVRGPGRESHAVKLTQVTRGNSGIRTQPPEPLLPTPMHPAPDYFPSVLRSPGLSATHGQKGWITMMKQ